MSTTAPVETSDAVPAVCVMMLLKLLAVKKFGADWLK